MADNPNVDGALDDDALAALVGAALDDIDGEVPDFARSAESLAFALRADAVVQAPLTFDTLGAVLGGDALVGVRNHRDERVVRFTVEDLVEVECTLTNGHINGQVVPATDEVTIAGLEVESLATGTVTPLRHAVEVDEFGMFGADVVAGRLRLRVALAANGADVDVVTEWIG